MRSLIVHLLALTLLLAQAHSFAIVGSCGCINETKSSIDDNGLVELVDSCCAPVSSIQGDESEQSPKLPCQNSDCPANCCTAFTMHAHLPAHRASPVPAVQTPMKLMSTDLGEHAPPHLKKLKRPPRSA